MRWDEFIFCEVFFDEMGSAWDSRHLPVVCG